MKNDIYQQVLDVFLQQQHKGFNSISDDFFNLSCFVNNFKHMRELDMTIRKHGSEDAANKELYDSVHSIAEDYGLIVPDNW